GDELKVDFIRNKKKQQARVRLSESRGLVSQDVATAPAGEVLADIGMTVRDLSTAEAGRLPKGGVIVESIRDNSRVAKTNMERNFIITEVNGVRVKTAKELRHEISRARTGLYLEGYYERFPGDFAYTLDLN